jgi:Fe-S oxidoreductase
MLQDGWTYEQWRDKFGAQLVTGIAWCHLKINKDTKAAREVLSRITEAQYMEMDETSFFGELIVKVD